MTVRSMQTIVDLFGGQDFARISVEGIAPAPKISRSSIRHYFRMKDGIILADNFNPLASQELADALDPDDLIGAVLAIVAHFESGTQICLKKNH